MPAWPHFFRVAAFPVIVTTPGFTGDATLGAGELALVAGVVPPLSTGELLPLAGGVPLLEAGAGDPGFNEIAFPPLPATTVAETGGGTNALQPPALTVALIPLICFSRLKLVASSSRSAGAFGEPMRYFGSCMPVTSKSTNCLPAERTPRAFRAPCVESRSLSTE